MHVKWRSIIRKRISHNCDNTRVDIDLISVNNYFSGTIQEGPLDSWLSSRRPWIQWNFMLYNTVLCTFCPLKLDFLPIQCIVISLDRIEISNINNHKRIFDLKSKSLTYCHSITILNWLYGRCTVVSMVSCGDFVFK